MTPTHVYRITAGTAVALLLCSFSPEVAVAAGNAPKPSICTRSCWGARSPSGTLSEMSGLNRAIVHHTAGTEMDTTGYEDSKANVRAIQNLHMDTNGWSDIGYHFLCDKYGYTFEGRQGSMSGLPKGAHDGTNSNSFGFNIMGYFHPNVNDVPTAAMMDALYDVIAWRMPSGWAGPYGSPGTYGPLGNNVGYVDGHRRVKLTSCPGDNAFNPYMGTDMNAGTIRAEIKKRIDGTVDSNGSGVDACSWGEGRIDIFTRGLNNELRHKYFVSGSGWSAWINEGGTIYSDPSVVSWGPGRIDVFAKDSDGSLLHKWFENGWSAWEDLGGSFISAPDACSFGSGRLDVFVRGSDYAIYQKYYSGGKWSAWVSHGGSFNSDPTASASSGRIDVMVRGSNNNIFQKYWVSGTGWSAWVNLGGTCASGPDACSWGSGRLDYFVRGGGDAVFHKYFNGSTWSPYYSLEGITKGDPGCCSWGTGRVDVFARGGGDDIYHKYLIDSTWSGYWENLGH